MLSNGVKDMKEAISCKNQAYLQPIDNPASVGLQSIAREAVA